MANLIGPVVAAAGPTSQVWSTSPFPHTVGAMANDQDGNQYLYVSAVTAVSGPGILVSITPDHQVAPLLHTTRLNARVGVAMARMDTNVAGWVQVYGVAFVQGNNMAANAVGVGASTDATSIGVLTSTSEADANGLLCIPQLVVTSPTGTLNLVERAGAANTQSSLVSDVSNTQFGALNVIQGMYLLTAAQVSALPDRIITDHWPTVTSPVSAVSNTSGPVTLTTLVSGTTAVAGHIGGEWIVYLNYPILSGNPTSDA